MEKIKKIAGLIVAVWGALAVFAIAFNYTIQTVYHEEIEDFDRAIEFSRMAEDSLVPMLVNRLKVLQEWKTVKSKTTAIGLRKDTDTGDLWYRAGFDLRLYRAYYIEDVGAYYYVKEGREYECH